MAIVSKSRKNRRIENKNNTVKISQAPIIVSQEYQATPLEVWNAITRPQQMRKWYFEQIIDFKAQVGFKTQFTIQHNNRTFTHQWEITEVILQKKLSYSWQYKEYPGLARVDFELLPAENGVTLTLTNTVTEDFPDNIPEFTRESCLGGWQYFIQQQLKNYLE